MLPLLFLACAPQGPGELLLLPSTQRGGLPGEQGPYGAAWVRGSTTARVDERLGIEVVFPSDADGWLAEGGPFPVVAFVQGGLVDVEQYRWLNAQLASRGYLVVAARHPAGLALLASDDSAIALSAVERWSEREGLLHGSVSPGEPAAILGHSLGGAVGAIEWAADDRFQILGLLASFPADFTPVEEVDRPALSLVGSTDEVVDLSQVRAGFERLAGPRLYGEVQGLNHHGWFDDPKPRDTEKDGPLEGDLELLRANTTRVVDTFLDAWLRQDQVAQSALATGEFEGVEVSP